MKSVFEQDLERLVKKYNRPGPRYTSYPTVPVWPQGNFGKEYAEALEVEGGKERGISIYVHIPFCRIFAVDTFTSNLISNSHKQNQK